jgi:transcription initiation factor IIE alpha subunit
MEKIPFICKEHGEYWKRIDNRLYYSQKCPVCSKKIQENINHNIKKRRTDYPFMDEIRPDYQLKIIKGEIGCMEKIPFICNIHGEYLQSLKDHNKGNGCPKCGNSRKGRRKNNE